MTKNILIAGFGGQGILFAGKFLVYAGLKDGFHVSHLPSYGPEMRGGTANCGVIISSAPIGSPIVDEPDILIAMNRPSYDKFIERAVTGAMIFIDSSLVKADNAGVFKIPATRLASENGLEGLANMIIIGAYLNETKMFSPETVRAAMEKCVPKTKADLIEKNLRAIEIGKNALDIR